MNKIITQVIGLAVIATVFTTSLAAQDVAETQKVSVEVEPGLMNFRYIHYIVEGYYFNEQVHESIDDMRLTIINDNEKTTFTVDTISEGRYLLSIDHEYGSSRQRRYLFCFAHPDMGIEFETPPTEEALENSYMHRYPTYDYYTFLHGCILSVDAIRTDNTLMVLGDPLQLQQPIMSIDLNKTNNFTFSFSQPNDADDYSFGDRLIVLNSELGGELFVDGASARLKVRGKVPASIVQTVFMPEPLQGDDPNSNEPLATETAHAYAANGTLTVQSPVAEEVSIYSANGTLYLQKHKDSGIATYDITALPQGVLIVKGSSGWAKKVVND